MLNPRFSEGIESVCTQWTGYKKEFYYGNDTNKSGKKQADK